MDYSSPLTAKSGSSVPHSSPHATESNCSLDHSSPHATAVNSSVGRSSPGTELGRIQDHSSRHASQGSGSTKTPSNDSKASADADGRMHGQQNAVAELQLQVAELRAGREEDQKQLAEGAAAAQELKRRAHMPSYTFVSMQTSALLHNVCVNHLPHLW